MQDLNDKVVFIAGGGSGIGFGIAQAFKDAGARLAIADIDDAAAKEAASRLSDEVGKAASVWLDVSDPSAWARAADTVERELGGVDILCNTPGLLGVPRPLVDIPPDRIRRIFDVTVFGVIYGVKCFAPRMQKRGGHIIHVSSMAGLDPVPTRADYCAAKSAVVAISECLAVELEPDGIGVTVVCPGLVNTRLAETSAKQLELETATVSPAPSSVPMEPIEVGRLVVEAARRRQLYVFTHPVNRQRLERRFDKVLSAFD